MKNSARERSGSTKQLSVGDYNDSQNPGGDRKSVDPDRLSINIVDQKKEDMSQT